MMTYHAFLFDYDGFACELKPLVEECLRSGTTPPLEAFIERNRCALRSVMTGEPLAENWRAEIEGGGPTDYAELALTKYYDEEADNLVMGKWRRFVEAFNQVGGREEIALGEVIGPPECIFDPTSQGSFFQSRNEVERHLEIINGWLELEESLPEELMELRDMFQTARDAGRGLYVKFI
jgi:hypothetical protein